MRIYSNSLSGSSSAFLKGETLNEAKPSGVGKSSVKITGCPGSSYVLHGYVTESSCSNLSQVIPAMVGMH